MTAHLLGQIALGAVAWLVVSLLVGLAFGRLIRRYPPQPYPEVDEET